MTARRHGRHRRAGLAIAAAAGLVTVAAISAPAAIAAPKVSNCGANADVARIDTVTAAGPDYIIKVTPTKTAREAGARRDVVESMWHQIQSCVPGLYSTLADSVWQQLECHQMYPYEFATGPTYDLETWRDVLPVPNPVAYANTRCLNKTSILGMENGRPGTGNNFPGYLDMVEANRTIA